MKPRILNIDLTTGSFGVEDIPDDLQRRYLGGRGINSALLYENTKKGMDPLAPESPIIFGAGMLTGMPGPAASRLTVTGKSPETGLLGDSNIGGEFGSALASTGIRHVYITGRSEGPVYVYIEKKRAGLDIRIRDASGLWGRDTLEAQALIKGRCGEDAQAACIGPAGENLVRFACVMHGKKNAAGRTGMGCLMGAKNLKAVVVKGGESPVPRDPDAFRALTRGTNAKLKGEFLADELSRFGTAHLYNVINNNIEMGRAYNGLSTVMSDPGDMAPETLKERFYTARHGCRHCPVACRHAYEVRHGPRAGLSGEGPEYGVMGHMGPVLGINSVEAVLALNDALNRLGLDASSAGNIIAWATELYAEGIIDDGTTGGVRLGWNEPETVLRLLGDIAHRRGFGDVLADGAMAASERFGSVSRERMIWVKGLPQSDPVDLRFIKAFALGVATATRGADHLRSRCPWEAFEYDADFLAGIYGGPVEPDPRSYAGKGRVVWWWESYLSLFDALGLCKLLAFHTLPEPGVFDFELFAGLIRAGTGVEMTADEVFGVGERMTTTERAYICREGVTRKDDYPPARYFEPLKLTDGVDEQSRSEVLEREGYDMMLDEYYACHGWDVSTGVPRI